MEKGINAYIREQFAIEKVDLKTYSPLTLAYIGDDIYDLVIRSIVVDRGNTKAGKLHQTTSQLVKAHAQSEMMHAIEPLLSEEEQDVFRRGRNAKSPTMAKNATMSDYRRASGFEALMGYLYLKDDFKRIVELVKCGLSHYDAKTGKTVEENGEADGQRNKRRIEN